MGRWLIVLFVIVIASLFSWAVFSFNNEKPKSEGKNFQFKTFTSAVCEHKNNMVYCKDELFVNCSGKISKSNESEECSGFKIDNAVTGFAVFEKGSLE